MEVLNETATHNGGLETRPAPEALRPFVEMFVHRNETVDGNVVRVLPETRSSVQFRLANPYWVRKRAAASVWQRVPDISIWAPRHKWGYGFANAQVRVFAFSLTPAGIQALFDQPISAYVDTILDASEFYCFQTLTKVELGDCFQTWVARMSKALIVFFENADPTPPVSNNALSMLATISSGSVAKAAMMEG